MNLFKEINLILGDHASKITKGLSKEDIKQGIAQEILTYEVKPNSTLGEVAQLYMDKVIGTRRKLIDRLDATYETLRHKEEWLYKLIFDSKVVKTLFDTRFFKVLPLENQSIHTPFDDPKTMKEKEEKIYKLFGYFQRKSNEVILTSQDIRKLKIGMIYEDYWKRVIADFQKYDTVLFADDMLDRDFLEVFSTLLQYNRDSEKKIYVLAEDVIAPEIQNFIDRHSLTLMKGGYEKFFEYLKEREREENRVEPKNVDIQWDNEMGSLETAEEVRYQSLKIGKLPISRSTFCHLLNFENENSLGVGEITLKGKKIKECNVKLFQNQSMKVFEIGNGEFKLGIEAEVTPQGELKFKGKDFYYNIFKGNDNEKIMKSIEFFMDFFSGEEIRFKTEYIDGTLKLENRIEVLRLQVICDVLEKYKDGYNFSEIEDKIYNLDMLRNVENNYSYDSWINLDFKKEIEFNPGDNLNIERIHEIKLKNIDYDILEKIEFVGEKKENYRGKAKITLKKKSKSEVEFKSEEEIE